MESELISACRTVKKGLVPGGGFQKQRKVLDLYPLERKKMKAMLESAVLGTGVLSNQRSNSVVVHGPPGCGKTFVSESNKVDGQNRHLEFTLLQRHFIFCFSLLNKS